MLTQSLVAGDRQLVVELTAQLPLTEAGEDARSPELIGDKQQHQHAEGEDHSVESGEHWALRDDAS